MIKFLRIGSRLDICQWGKYCKIESLAEAKSSHKFDGSNPSYSTPSYRRKLWLDSTRLDSTSNHHNCPKYRYSTWGLVKYRTTIWPTIRPWVMAEYWVFFRISRPGRVICRSLLVMNERCHSITNCQNDYWWWFGVTAQWGAVHSVCRQMLTLRAGLETMMRCRRVELVMMWYSPVGIPLEVSSLADEVIVFFIWKL